MEKELKKEDVEIAISNIDKVISAVSLTRPQHEQLLIDLKNLSLLKDEYFSNKK